MKKILKYTSFLAIILYVSITLINQQKTLNSYKQEQNSLAAKIKEQENLKDNLNKIKQNISSTEYIEEVAREKLDMYLPNERVYIDTAK
mgnify:CR=1 FL=1